jgi:predicted RNA binding protein YcfA (HicA-like mRNA interferase family)
MNYKQLTRRLKVLGCEFARQAPGPHEAWRNPANHRYTVIPRHAGRDIPVGTLHAILRQLGISLEDFDKHK